MSKKLSKAEKGRQLLIGTCRVDYENGWYIVKRATTDEVIERYKDHQAAVSTML